MRFSGRLPMPGGCGISRGLKRASGVGLLVEAEVPVIFEGLSGRKCGCFVSWEFGIRLDHRKAEESEDSE